MAKIRQGIKHMTYEDKVRLFNEKRYLMPLPPLRTKELDSCGITLGTLINTAGGVRTAVINANLYDESTLNNLYTSLNQLQAVDPEYCPYCGYILAGTDSKCPRCGYCVLCG